MSVIQFTVGRIRYRNRNSDKYSITFLFLLPSFTNIKSEISRGECSWLEMLEII